MCLESNMGLLTKINRIVNYKISSTRQSVKQILFRNHQPDVRLNNKRKSNMTDSNPYKSLKYMSLANDRHQKIVAGGKMHQRSQCFHT